MWQLRRVRLDRVGARAARFLDVTIDVSDDEGHPLDSILWLRNGGGKSTVLSLVCAVVRPHRRDFLATSATDKHLEDYVLGSDTAHVTVEWTGPAGRRLVTGAVYEWADRTQPADPNRDHDKLQARWYAFRPVEGRAELGLLPFARDGVALSLKDFTAAVRAWDTIPGCGVTVVDAQDRWGRVLDDHGLDPELFTAILQMNATEGGIESQFQFRNADAFVRYLLELIVDPEVPRSVGTILESVRAALAERPAVLADLAFADEAVPQLRELAAARTEHLAARDALTAAESAVADLRRALLAAAGSASAEGESLTARGRQESERATQEGRAADLDYNRAVELRRIAAVHRRRAAQQTRDDLVDEQAALQVELDAWRAVPRLDAVRAARRRVERLQSELHAAMLEAEPLRRVRDDAAAVFAAALDAAIDALTQRRDGLEQLERESRAAATDARRRRTELMQARGRAEARRDALEASIAAVDSELATAVDARMVEPGEGVAAAHRRHASLDADAQETLGTLAHERQALRRRYDELAAREAELREARTGRILQRDATVQRRDGLATRIAELAAEERLRLLAESDTFDVLAEGPDLVRLLAEQITRADRRRVEIAVEGAEDERAATALATTGLLPPVLDVALALAECEKSGLALTTGWSYLADSVPAHLRATVLAAAPALAGGLLVHDPADLSAAQQLLTSASLRPTTAVTVATTADLQAVVDRVAAGPVPSLFVVPPAGALTDRAAAGDELRLRDVARDTRASEDDELARRRSADDDLRRDLRTLLTDCPPGTLATLEQELAELTPALEALDGQLAEIPQRRAELEAAARDVEAAVTTAQETRRRAAEALAVLTRLGERLAAAEPQRLELEQLPAQIAAMAEAAETADTAETTAFDAAGAARREADSCTASFWTTTGSGQASGPSSPRSPQTSDWTTPARASPVQTPRTAGRRPSPPSPVNSTRRSEPSSRSRPRSPLCHGPSSSGPSSCWTPLPAASPSCARRRPGALRPSWSAFARP